VLDEEAEVLVWVDGEAGSFPLSRQSRSSQVDAIFAPGQEARSVTALGFGVVVSSSERPKGCERTTAPTYASNTSPLILIWPVCVVDLQFSGIFKRSGRPYAMAYCDRVSFLTMLSRKEDIRAGGRPELVRDQSSCDENNSSHASPSHSSRS
jgi:hypothetical protein